MAADDIEVCLYEENEDGIIWEARGDFGQQDVHRQVGTVQLVSAQVPTIRVFISEVFLPGFLTARLHLVLRSVSLTNSPDSDVYVYHLYFQ